MIAASDCTLNGSLILAPLAGYSDLPFRLLCRQMGAAMCVSEMISCHGLVYKQAKTLAMLQSCAEERPVSYQLFGAEPAIMGEAAAVMATFEPDFIDINMGCPVKKVTKRGAGAALMTDFKLAEQIVRAVVESSGCPVTVKIRSGPDADNICACEFAAMAESNGASAVAVHGRTWKQAFSGQADWNIVADVKRSISIPVFGNGDILTYDQAVENMDHSGCDGVLIGRGAIGNPWIFTPSGRPSSIDAITFGVLAHMALIERFNENPGSALGAIKNHLGKYFKGMPGSVEMRKTLYEQPDWSSLKALVQSYGESAVQPI